MMLTQFHTIILAAGQGKRMRSDVPKVLHAVGGKALLWHVLQTAQILKPHKNILVVAQASEAVRAYIKAEFGHIQNLRFSVQKQQLGTGDAVRSALAAIPEKSGYAVVLCGDMPLLRAETLKAIVAEAKRCQAKVLVTTAQADTSSDFGRIVRQAGRIVGIVEKRDATAEQKNITEVNVGVYVFDLAFLRAHISKLKTKNAQKEYYLTDLVSLASAQGHDVASFALTDPYEALGVNSQADLHRANTVFYERQRRDFLNEGVSLLGDAVFIDAAVHLTPGCRLESPCYLKGATVVGAGTQIEMGCVLQDADIGEGVKIKAHSYISESVVADQSEIGPFAHLRPGTRIQTGAKVGNFVEIKKTTLGAGSKANHLTYLGDATIGTGVNVGAGTITCNYDGKNKFQTTIEDGVFIGSDSQLVAPVKIGKGAFVAAGTTVTHDVAAGALVLSRAPQIEKRDWAKRKNKKSKS